MDVAALLLELFGRIPPLARAAVEGLDAATLTTSIAPGANTIGWLVWHAARVQDDHMADIMEVDQVWAAGDWSGRFGLPAGTLEIGWGHTAEQMAAVHPEGPEAVIEYLDAVDTRTRGFLESLTPADLDRIVDRRWDPPVTMGVRLVSIADDSLQHVGQAAYVRGILGP